MHLKDYIQEPQIVLFEKASKSAVLDALVELLLLPGKIKNPERLREEIDYREKLMSTGIGLGVAIPHVRFEGIREPFVAVGVIKEGIPDYQSIDDVMIQVVFLVIVSKQQHKEYLQLMAQIVKTMKTPDRVRQLVDAEDADVIKELLTSKL